MSGKGYHLAISEELANRLRAQTEDDTAIGMYELRERMEASEARRVHGGYKDWDVLHRCLSDGTFNPDSGEYPLNQCFIGRLLVKEGATVNLVMPEAVRDVARALEQLTWQDWRDRFMSVYAREQNGISDAQTEEYYRKLAELRQFYRSAASEGLAIVFYTDDCLSYFFSPGGPS
jgi:hypothetical protein